MPKSSDPYYMVKRLDWIREAFLSGRSLNCSIIAARFDISTKTAQRDLNFVRDYYRMPIVYDEKYRVFTLRAGYSAPNRPS